MWLELSQFKTNFTHGNARKLEVNFTDLVTLPSYTIQDLRAIPVPSLRAAIKL